MQVDDISPRNDVSELADLIPEVREIGGRRRKRLVIWIAPVLAVVALVAVLISTGGRASPPKLPQGMLPPAPNNALATANVPSGLKAWPGLELFGLSCPARGECVAIGDLPVGNRDLAVAVTQRNGVWGEPVIVGGSKPTQAASFFRLISCATVDDCIASTGSAPNSFLVAESRGRWGPVHRLPLSGEQLPRTTACSSNGQCWLVVGAYSLGTGTEWMYVVGENNGHWLPPFRLGGPSFHVRAHSVTASGTVAAQIFCTSASSCTVVGRQHLLGDPESFAQTETRGRWTLAVPAFRVIARAEPRRALTWSSPSLLACTSSDTCLLAGTQEVYQEIDGHWLPPVRTVGDVGPYVHIDFATLACVSDVLCEASGYSGTAGDLRVIEFAQADVNGHWLAPQALPVLGTGSVMSGAACPTTSMCDVIGQFDTASGRNLSFEATFSSSSWHYWIVSIGAASDSTIVNGISCSGGTCWVSGNEFRKGGAPLKGFVFPFKKPIG